MVEAERLAGKDAGEIAAVLALLSRIATIDGRVLPFEDLQDLDMEDLTAMNVDFSQEPRPAPPGAQEGPPSGS
jgi:hypothetical protein